MTMIRLSYVIGIHLLITSQISYSLVLLSANIEDVKKLAMQFVPEPLAEQITNFLSKATFMKTQSLTGETIRNGLAKLSYIDWNDGEHRDRGVLDTSEEGDKNHISVKRGRDISSGEHQETSKSTFVDAKRNYVYDYALKQENTKKPIFEWEKGANYDIAVLTNQEPLFDTTTTQTSRKTTKAKLRIINGSTKKTVNVKRPHSKLEERKPIREKPLYPIHSVQKPDKDVHRPIKEQYSNILKLLGKKELNSNGHVQRPPRKKAHKIVIKEIRKPVKYPGYKEVSKPTKLDIKLQTSRSAQDTKEQSKEWNVVDTYSEESSDVNKVELDEESNSNRIDDSVEPVGSTRFVDYERSNNGNYQSERSIYTKDVLATSGPVELLRAKVNFLASSDDNSLNEENKKYFKQYDNESHSDLRRHLDEKSVDEETTITTVQMDFTKAANATEVNEINEVSTEGANIKDDEANNTKTSWYGGATVYNNVQTEQVTNNDVTEKSK